MSALQDLAALDTELSICLSFALLRAQRLQDLADRCRTTHCLDKVNHLRERLRPAFEVCERDAVERPSALTPEQRCHVADMFRTTVLPRMLCANPTLNVDAPVCKPCGIADCPKAPRRDTRPTARVLAHSPALECPVRGLIELGVFGAGLANCYANAVNPFVQGQELSECLKDLQPSSLSQTCPQCLRDGNVMIGIPGMRDQVCLIAKDVLGSCLAGCTRISCDDGDPCTADFCDGTQCRNIAGNDGAKCGPLNNPCIEDVCSAGKCGRPKTNGTLCDPAKKCCFCADGNPHAVTCKTGCFCSDTSGCLSEMTGQACQ